MTTATLFDYKDIEIATGEKSITLSWNGQQIYSLRQGLREKYQTALLRVGDIVAFYQVTQCVDLPSHSTEEMLRQVMPRIEGGLFYILGMPVVRTRKNRFKAPCRAVLVGAHQIALRDSRLLFTPIYVRDLGNLNLDDTGDTTTLYTQLNNLI